MSVCISNLSGFPEGKVQYLGFVTILCFLP